MPYMGNQPSTSFSSVSYQDLTGSNGTSFTLDFPVGNAQEIEVFVNNVRQEPGVAYTANGTELITTGSISISDDFYVVFSGKAQQSATHPANQDLDANNGTFSGDLTVDTNTLYVDSTNNRVGIVNASPTTALDVTGDITVSGGVYLGGTGSANYLDDYEEGVFTPVAEGESSAGSGTYNYQVGSYVKVGSLVLFQANLGWTSHSGSGTFRLSGLPFTAKNTTNLFAVAAAYLSNLPVASNHRAMPFVRPNTSYVNINQENGSGGASSVNIDAAAQVLITGSYRTDA